MGEGVVVVFIFRTAKDAARRVRDRGGPAKVRVHAEKRTRSGASGAREAVSEQSAFRQT